MELSLTKSLKNRMNKSYKILGLALVIMLPLAILYVVNHREKIEIPQTKEIGDEFDSFKYKL